MKYLIPKDKRHRKAASRKEWYCLLLKAIVDNSFLSEDIRNAAWQRLTLEGKSGRFTTIRNRCAVSGRGHAVLRIFKLARTPFHIDANMGKLPGVRRSSW
jgi:small subunit ribosomal protein S14